MNILLDKLLKNIAGFCAASLDIQLGPLTGITCWGVCISKHNT